MVIVKRQLQQELTIAIVVVATKRVDVLCGDGAVGVECDTTAFSASPDVALRVLRDPTASDVSTNTSRASKRARKIDEKRSFFTRTDAPKYVFS